LIILIMFGEEYKLVIFCHIQKEGISRMKSHTGLPVPEAKKSH
jgi:hypothetical protein